MFRILNIFLVLGVIASAFVLYSLELSTRGMERHIAALEAGIADKTEEIGLLKAEWSSLTRPERLQALAEKHLKLQRVAAKQLLKPEELALKVPDEPVTKLEKDGKDPIGDILKAME